MKKILLGLIMTITLSEVAMASIGDDPLITKLVMDKFEILDNDENSKVWEGSFYMGYDINKLYLYSEGEASSNEVYSSKNEILYSRAIAPFWDIQAGIAYDKNDYSSTTWAEVAISGLAPYYFETRVALLLGEDSNIGLRASAEYEALITQKLILTPSIDISLYSKDNIEMQIGSGLSSIDMGLRLRYEIVREFAPYIGINWEKNFGNTYDYNPLDETSMVVGIRFWF
jgi:copper resistance protein B